MRRRNFADMTVVEQLMEIKEQVCAYSCKYREEASNLYSDETMRKLYLQRYCHECPLSKVHYKGDRRHGI